MKVLLIQPEHELQKNPPLGLLYLASYVEANGHDATVLDLGNEKKDVVNYIERENPDVIGVSVTTPYFVQAVNMLKKINNLNIPTILGGPHSSSRPQDLTNYCDQIIRGDGEIEFLNSINQIQKGEKIQKIVRAEQIKNIDIIPPPAREKINLKEYDVPGAMITSRGCPFNCSFCWKLYKSWAPHSPHRITSEIGYLVNKGFKSIHWWDDNSFLNHKRMFNIIRILEKEKYDIKIRASMRVDLAKKELLNKMARIGMDYVSFGVESTDPDVLKMCNKGINLDQVRKAVRNAKEAGMYVHLYFVIGLPGSTLEKTKKDIEFALSTEADIVCPQPATPYPATEMYDWVQKHGNIIKEDWSIFGHGEDEARDIIPFDTPDFSKEERLHAIKLWFNAKQHLINKSRKRRARNPLNWPGMGKTITKICTEKIKSDKEKKDMRFSD